MLEKRKAKKLAKVIKKKERFKNASFLAVILTFLSIPLVANDISISEGEIQNFADALAGGRTILIAMIMINGLPIILKACEKLINKTFSWTFFIKKNFIFQTVTIIFYMMAQYGVITEDMHVELIASATQAINMIWHFIEDYKNELDLTDTALS